MEEIKLIPMESKARVSWGVANSAFQVEGFPEPSDWTHWTHTPGRILDGTNADLATEFWMRYSEDFDLARELGADTFRISLAWERIQPTPGKFSESALGHYREILRAMRDRGLEPWVTLHHFVLPAWVAEQGGVLSKEFPKWFAAFAAYTVKELSKNGLVRNWMTFNEPNVLVRSGFLEGEWPPGKTNAFKDAALASFHLAAAHLTAINQIRALHSAEENARLRFGIATHWRAFQPKSARFVDRVACRLTNWVFNRQIIDAAASGKIRTWLPGTRFHRRRIRMAGNWRSLDFLGINYYGRTLVSGTTKAPFILAEEGAEGTKSDLGWESYPRGLFDVLKATHRLYGVPVAVTENGIADQSDALREQFLKDHVDSMLLARNEGIPVEAYFYWSLTDNFEWAHGERPRFGLVEIDYATRNRRKRPSFETYRKIIAAHHALPDCGEGG